MVVTIVPKHLLECRSRFENGLIRNILPAFLDITHENFEFSRSWCIRDIVSAELMAASIVFEIVVNVSLFKVALCWRFDAYCLAPAWCPILTS